MPRLHFACAAALLVGSCANAQAGSPPNEPVVIEPSATVPVNAGDVHMSTEPFSDPDPGDQHRCSDWRFFKMPELELVWTATCVTGVLKTHIHLGDGTFMGSHAGRTSCLPDTTYWMYVRFRDDSDDIASEYGEWAWRQFTTGSEVSVFPLEVLDVSDLPPPRWEDSTGEPVVLPDDTGPQPFMQVQNGQSTPLLTIAAWAGAGNQVTNPSALEQHHPMRIVMNAGPSGLTVPESLLRFTDELRTEHEVLMPAVSLAGGQTLALWISDNGSTYFGDLSQTAPDFSAIARAASLPWEVLVPGYRVEIASSGFQLPVNIAFVPNPGPDPDSPMYYVTELYGKIKVVARNGLVSTYAQNLLDYDPLGAFPGAGEGGVAGTAVDPATGDVIAAMVLDQDPAPNSYSLYNRIDRFTSIDGGRTAATRTVLASFPNDESSTSHQISSINLKGDGSLWVNTGDGFTIGAAQDLNTTLGKVLRISLATGQPMTDNPFYNAADGITATDYIYARGLRNPFGGCKRAADGRLYLVENGPGVDRFAQVQPGRNFAYDGSDASMATFAIYNWAPAHAPVNIAFVQPQTFGGSGFPAPMQDRAFVTESGGTWAPGPASPLGKMISYFTLNASGSLVGDREVFLRYTGPGRATCAALAAGPDGLYFSDLYKDNNYTSPIDAGANIMRVRYVGIADFSVDIDTGLPPLSVQFTDQSVMPAAATWHWDFGDGATSTLRNPSHLFAYNGSFPVRLTVRDASGLVLGAKTRTIRAAVPARVAVIGGNPAPNQADADLLDKLQLLDFTTAYYDDEAANRPSSAVIAQQNDVVIVTGTADGNQLAGEFRTENLPMLFWQPTMLEDLIQDMCDYSSTEHGLSTIEIVNNTHPVTQGVPLGPLVVYDLFGSVGHGVGLPPPGATPLARIAGDPTMPTILVAETGAQLRNEFIAPARRAFIFLWAQDLLPVSDLGYKLFRQSLCWTLDLPPVFVTQPQNAGTPEGTDATFSVEVTGRPISSYRWRHNGVPLYDGVPPVGAAVSGAGSPILILSGVAPSDAGQYECEAIDPCGGTLSTTAQLTVEPPCPDLDFNNDDVFPDIVDLVDFLTVFSGGPCSTGNCDSIDYNGDEVFPDTDDLLQYLNDFSIGC